MHEVEIVNALVCDDVRREDNGKEILIGVYGANISVQKFPANLSLRLWMQIRPLRTGDMRFSIRMINEKGVEFFSAKGGINVEEANQLGSFSVGGGILQAQSEMTLIFQLNIDEKGWENIIEIPINKQPQVG